MLSLDCFLNGTLAIATNLGIEALPEWQDVVYHSIKNDFTNQEFMNACNMIIREEELYNKMPNVKLFLKYAPTKISNEDLRIQKKTKFLNKVCEYLQLNYISQWDKDEFNKDMSELEYRTLQSAGGISEMYQRVHNLDFPTNIATIRKELSSFYDDNFTCENVNKQIAIISNRGEIKSIGNVLQSYSLKYNKE